MCKRSLIVKTLCLATLFAFLLPLAGCKTGNPLQELSKTMESLTQPQETMEYMSEADEAYVIQAARKAESGKALLWKNPKSGVRYHLTLKDLEYGEGSEVSRPFTLYAVGDLNRMERVDGAAVSKAMGEWKVTAKKAAVTVTDAEERGKVLADLDTPASAPASAEGQKATGATIGLAEAMPYLTRSDLGRISSALRTLKAGDVERWEQSYSKGLVFALTSADIQRGADGSIARPFRLYALGDLERIERVDGVATSASMGEWTIAAQGMALAVTEEADRGKALALLKKPVKTASKKDFDIPAFFGKKPTSPAAPKQAPAAPKAKQETLPEVKPEVKKETSSEGYSYFQENPQYTKYHDELSKMQTEWLKLDDAGRYEFAKQYKNKPLPCETKEGKTAFASKATYMGMNMDQDTPRCEQLRQNINTVIKKEEAKTPEMKQDEAKQKTLDEVFKF